MFAYLPLIHSTLWLLSEGITGYHQVAVSPKSSVFYFLMLLFISDTCFQQFQILLRSSTKRIVMEENFRNIVVREINNVAFMRIITIQSSITAARVVVIVIPCLIVCFQRSNIMVQFTSIVFLPLHFLINLTFGQPNMGVRPISYKWEFQA